MRPLIPIFILLVAISTSCNSQPSSNSSEPASILIKNVNVLDVRTGQILENQWVLIKGDRIASIGPASQVSANLEINGTGKFLMPGLAEMHAHIPRPDWGREDPEETLFLYAANGITTIRGMLGHPDHLVLRDRAARNELISPRILVASPPLNGRTVTTEEEAQEKVSIYAAEGYDLLKILPGIKRPVFDALVDAARAEGITFAGHVPVDVGIVHALESRFATIDHVDGFLEGMVPEEAAVNPEDNGFFGYKFTNLVDEERMDYLVGLAAENKVWVVPTQTLFERWFSPEEAVYYLDQPEMRYMPTSILSDWESSKNRFLEDESFNKKQWQRFNEIRRELIRSLHYEGYGLLLGSDAPQVFNVPGFSIYHELKAMVDAGLSPLAAFQTGTINAAKYLDMEGQMGELVEGASADMMLLSKNPLQELSTIRKPEYVIVKGTLLDREQIDKRLAEIAEKAAKQ